MGRIGLPDGQLLDQKQPLGRWGKAKKFISKHWKHVQPYISKGIDWVKRNGGKVVEMVSDLTKKGGTSNDYHPPFEDRTVKTYEGSGW
jgi:hypothetical protein